ncbi:MAG TPA: hypothetical protein VF131_01170 [Blastocatellia bacterium]|nr:hypothetical protein [Blastocatellia bacterium]
MDETLLIGTEKGLHRWNDKLEGTPELVDASMKAVYVIYRRGSTILIGSAEGLYRWSVRLDGEREHIDGEMGSVFTFHPMDSTLLIGAATGLYRWNDQFERKPRLITAELGGVTYLHQVGNILQIGATGGIFRWNDKPDGKPEFIHHQLPTINQLYPLADALLVGTDEGLYRWNNNLEGKPDFVDVPTGPVVSFFQLGDTILIGAATGLYRWNNLDSRPEIVPNRRLTYARSFCQMSSILVIGTDWGLCRWDDWLEGKITVAFAELRDVVTFHQLGNSLLMGTSGDGVFRWNDKLEGKPEFKDPSLESIYSYHLVGSTLLLGAKGGLYKWNDKLEGSPKVVDSPMVNVVHFFQIGSTLLIGSSGGLYRWNDKLQDRPDVVSLTVRSPTSFYQMGSILLIGVAGGIYRWNVRLDDNPEFINASIGTPYSFHKVGETLLVGTEKGLYKWNERLEGSPKPTDLPLPPVGAFHQVGSTILIGTADGLYRWSDRLEGSPEVAVPLTAAIVRFGQIGSTLLVSTNRGVFRTDGVGIKWQADIQVEPLPQRILSDSRMTLAWTIKNYERRANPDNVRMRIILRHGNGALVTTGADGNPITDDQWKVPTGQHQFTLPNLAPGNFLLTVEATDLTGNTSESKPIEFKVYSSLEESFLDWGKLLAFFYAAATIILFIILVLGARKSKRCFDILTDPLTRKLSLFFGFAVRYIRPVRIWVFERYFDELKKDWAGNNLYVPYDLFPLDDRFDGAPVNPIESTEIINRLKNEKRILILGGPGTGKSALVRNLMHTYCQEPSLHSAWKKYGFIPIPVRLRELAASQTVKVSELARSALAGKEMTFDKDDSFFESLLRNSDFLIVLDGLNEVNIESAVDEFAVSHSSVRLLTTSQTDSISDSFKRYRLPFFDPDFAKTLLRRFVGDEQAEKAIKDAPELWKEIKSGYDVRLVEHLIGFSRPYGQRASAPEGNNFCLPRNRLELYKAMVDYSKTMYDLSNVQMKAFPYVRICEHAWNMWRNGQYVIQPDEGLAQPEIEHLVKTNLALKRNQAYEFMHSLMRDFLSAEFCTRHSGPIKLMIKTRIEGADADKIWKLPPSDQAPVFSFLTESIDEREDLQEIFQFASESIKERHQLMIAVQEAAKKKGWQIQVNINIEL